MIALCIMPGDLDARYHLTPYVNGSLGTHADRSLIRGDVGNEWDMVRSCEGHTRHEALLDGPCSAPLGSALRSIDFRLARWFEVAGRLAAAARSNGSGSSSAGWEAIAQTDTHKVIRCRRTDD